MADFQLSNMFAVQSVCANPLWTPQSGYTGAPSSLAAGVDVAASVAAGWQVQLRPRAAVTGFPGRQVVISIDTLDDAADYTLTVDGTDCTYSASGGDTIADVLEGWAAVINAEVTASLVVVAVATSTTLTVTGLGEADWTIGLAATGTAEVSGVADPTTASARWWVYGSAGSNYNTNYASGQAWTLAGGLPGLTYDYRGAGDIVATNWAARLYVELYGITGSGDVAGSGATITYAAQVVIGASQGSGA